MTVREWANSKTNNGSYKVYSRKKRMYVNPQDVWDEKVLSLREHRGYGFKQIDVVLQVR